MNRKNNLKRIGTLVAEHILYGNIVVIIAVLMWLYVFITDYYFTPQEDFSFIASKSSDIYDVTLNRKVFNDVYNRYLNKQTTEVEIPSSVHNPF